MTQALPIHVINEIERRWQRRLDALPQVKPGKNDDGDVERCPLCGAPASIEPTMPTDAATRRDHVCRGCGHAWRHEVQ